MDTANSDILHFTCAIDNSFAYPLSVMLTSLLENHKNNRIQIHLFSATLSESYIEKFDHIITNTYKQKFKFYKLNPGIFANFRVNERISYAAYYRIVMPEIINQEVERFLYLDADMVINKNLEGLFKLDIQDKIFAAVHDIAAVDWKMYVKHHIPENYLYFNSGVLLIDRKKWIDLKFTQKVIQYLSENMNICDYHDQDGLNGALYEYRYALSPIWNQQIGIFFIHPALIKQVYGDEYIKAKKCPAIIHFNGLEKPWYNVSKHPWSKKFKLYADKVTDFSYTDHHSLKKWIKKNLVYNIFGWKNVNKYFYYSTRLKY